MNHNPQVLVIDEIGTAAVRAAVHEYMANGLRHKAIDLAIVLMISDSSYG